MTEESFQIDYSWMAPAANEETTEIRQPITARLGGISTKLRLRVIGTYRLSIPLRAIVSNFQIEADFKWKSIEMESAGLEPSSLTNFYISSKYFT